MLTMFMLCWIILEAQVDKKHTVRQCSKQNQMFYRLVSHLLINKHHIIGNRLHDDQYTYHKLAFQFGH